MKYVKLAQAGHTQVRVGKGRLRSVLICVAGILTGVVLAIALLIGIVVMLL